MSSIVVVLSLSHVFCNPMDLAHQASLSIGFPRKYAEVVTIAFSKGFYQSRGGTCVCCLAGRSFTSEPPGKFLEFSYNIWNLECLPPLHFKISLKWYKNDKKIYNSKKEKHCLCKTGSSVATFANKGPVPGSQAVADSPRALKQEPPLFSLRQD